MILESITGKQLVGQRAGHKEHRTIEAHVPFRMEEHIPPSVYMTEVQYIGHSFVIASEYQGYYYYTDMVY